MSKDHIILQVDQLTKTFGKEEVIQPLSFSLEKGKCICLIGPNGAGKTTVLRMLAGLYKPSSGSISYAGQAKQDFRDLVGYLPQEPAIYAWMTGLNYLLFSAKVMRIPKKKALVRAESLLKRVNIYEDRHKQIHTYSGGMKQRLGIAQALIHQPELLILDEPVSALDPLGRREILTLMEELKKETTILFSTHILSDADEVSDGLLLLHEGKLVEHGSIHALRHKYETASIALQFSENIEQYEAIIKQLPHVISTHIQRYTLHIASDDILKLRQLILEKTLAENWPLTQFKIHEASLEDMFMKVVNQ